MTIDDIAKEAGVSSATVSRVLNGKRVKAGNQTRITETIARHGYVPNVHARGLMRVSMKSIGVVVSSFSNAYYVEIADSLKRRASTAGYKLFLCSTDGSSEAEREYVTDLVTRHYDAAVIVDFAKENFTSGFLARCAEKVPVILVHSFMDVFGLDSVVIDQTLGMKRVMEHLWTQGYRDVSFMRGRKGFSYDAKQEAWKDWILGHGRKAAAEAVITVEDGNTEDAIALAESAMTALIRSGKAPEAVFACNDILAQGIINACLRNGLRVPEDMAVVGHDNTILAVSGPVPLTSVDMKMKLVGELVADMVLKRKEKPDSQVERVFLAPELIMRESSRNPHPFT